MKKKLVVFGLVFLLLTGLGLAANESNGDANELGETIGGLADTSAVGDKTNEVLSKEIEIPENWQLITKVLFGLGSEDKVELQSFVVLIGFWIILLILIVSLLDIMVHGWKKWVLGAVVTLIIAITGSIREIAVWFIGLGNFFGFLKEHGFLRFIFALIVMAVLFYFFLKSLKIIKGKMGVEEMTSVGRNIRFNSEMGKIQRETIGKR